MVGPEVGFGVGLAVVGFGVGVIGLRDGAFVGLEDGDLVTVFVIGAGVILSGGSVVIESVELSSVGE